MPGQTCVCANRILVQEGVYDAFAEKLAAAVTKLKVGDGTEQGVTDRSADQQRRRRKVEEHIDDAVEKGAQASLPAASRIMGGNFFEPTIIRDVTTKMVVAREETFGPVAPLFRFKTEEEAIAMANATEFGLACYFYTRDPRTHSQTIVTAEHTVAQRFAKLRRDLAFMLDRQVRKATACVELIRRGERAGRTHVETGAARAAMILLWRIRLNLRGGQDGAEKEPGAVVTRHEIGVLALPAETSALRQWLLHQRRCIDEDLHLAPVSCASHCASCFSLPLTTRDSRGARRRRRQGHSVFAAAVQGRHRRWRNFGRRGLRFRFGP